MNEQPSIYLISRSIILFRTTTKNQSLHLQYVWTLTKLGQTMSSILNRLDHRYLIKAFPFLLTFWNWSILVLWPSVAISTNIVNNKLVMIKFYLRSCSIPTSLRKWFRNSTKSFTRVFHWNSLFADNTVNIQKLAWTG